MRYSATFEREPGKDSYSLIVARRDKTVPPRYLQGDGSWSDDSGPVFSVWGGDMHHSDLREALEMAFAGPEWVTLRKENSILKAQVTEQKALITELRQIIQALAAHN